jgi:formate dehydrogenase subunit gamma
MDLLTTARSPWGESIFTHISWSLFWASLVGGLLFLLAHGGYMLFSQHHKRSSEEVDRMERERGGLPAHISRHGFVARAFHWVMAVSMLTLLLTAFLPIVGVRFAWVQWHWMAGVLLTASVLFHIFHATFVLDFWSIWVGPKDIPEFKAEMMRDLGKEVPG